MVLHFLGVKRRDRTVLAEFRLLVREGCLVDLDLCRFNRDSLSFFNKIFSILDVHLQHIEQFDVDKLCRDL